jgi:hypothetical protein
VKQLLLCPVLVAACRHADPPPREPEHVAATPPVDANVAPPAIDAAPRSACLDTWECDAPCVTVDGHSVALPPVMLAHVEDHAPDGDTGAFTTFTIDLFDGGDQDCARHGYDALLSTTDGRLGFKIGTISWGGMMQVTDIRRADADPHRLTLCVAPTTLHMEGQPTIVVAGAFSAAVCP